MRQHTSYPKVNSIVKIFKVMELLVTKDEFQLAELCSLLEFPKTTVYRMLVTLESLGYVNQNPKTLAYGASTKIFELGSRVIQNLSVVEIAREVMIKLAEKTNETVNLGILSGTYGICIEKAETKQHLRIDQPVGYSSKAYHTAMGKSILAFLPEEEIKELFSNHTFSAGNPNSIKDFPTLLKELKRIRNRGYALDNEEFEIGVCCVGAPIFDHTNKVVAGLSVAGPTSRMGEIIVLHLIKLVMEAATTISSKLGSTIHYLDERERDKLNFGLGEL